MQRSTKIARPLFQAVLIGAITMTSWTAFAQEFPLTIENKFGLTEIDKQPERVVTLDYAGVDNVLALGFQPLTARKWFAPYENELWPWAQELSEVDPVVLEGNLDFEQIAKTNPDIILALRSGITKEEYDRLSSIAPVVAVPPGHADYDLNWIDQAELIARALGKTEAAKSQITAIETQIEETVAAHPEWQGKTFVMMTYWDGSVGLYTAGDSSVKFIKDLGLSVHPKVAELSPDEGFYTTISQEILPQLDADVVFWWAPANSPEINNLVARKGMRAVAEGREVFFAQDSAINGAIANGSLLSLPVAIQLVSEKIAAAIDGDPSTPVLND